MRTMPSGRSGPGSRSSTRSAGSRRRTPLNVRLGIASGLVVVGDLIGDGCRAGARRSSARRRTSPPGCRRWPSRARSSLPTSTRRQIGTLFEIEDLGPQPLAGFCRAAARLARASAKAASSAASRHCARRHAAGRPRRRARPAVAALAAGESRRGAGGAGLGRAGIGKSRLTAALSQRIESEPHTRLRYFCSPHHQDSALYPFIGQLERAAGFARDDTAEQKLGKLQAIAGARRRADEDEIDVVGRTAVVAEFRRRAQPQPAAQTRADVRGADASTRGAGAGRPVLMVFEDAHWIDPTSRELLDLTLDRVRAAAGAARRDLPSRVPARLGRPAAGDDAGTEPARPTRRRGAGRSGSPAMPALPRDRRRDRRAHRRRAAVCRGVDKGGARKRRSRQRVAAVLTASPLPDLAIPATLHASLMARLDRLGPVAKEVAQIGAVIGREFGYELIEQVAQRLASRTASRARPARRGRAVVLPRHARRNPPTCSSTRWCRTPPTAPCCARDARNCTLGSRRHWRGISPISSSASPSCSRII